MGDGPRRGLTQTDAGQAFAIDGGDILGMQDGKLAEHWGVIDSKQLLAQLNQQNLFNATGRKTMAVASEHDYAVIRGTYRPGPGVPGSERQEAAGLADVRQQI